MQAVIVTLDHLALAFLGCYGTTRIRTPHVDRFASGSVVFDQCYGAADGPRAFSGLAKLVQRLHAAGHYGVTYRSTNDATDDTGLRAAIAGWRRAADSGSQSLLWLQSPGIASPWTASPDQIVAAWRSAFPNDSLADALKDCDLGPIERAEPEAMIAAVWPQVISQGWLSRDRLAASIPIGRLRWCIYAATVSALDRWLGEVLALVTDSARPDALLIVAAAAGDLTGLHPELAAGCPPLIDALIHVPLLIRTGTSRDGTRRNGLVSVSDLAPTLAEWFHIEHAGSGHSLWPLLDGDAHTVRDELLIGSDDAGWSLRTPEFACLARTDDMAHEFPEHAWLFAKPDDAWETLNVARQSPEITAEYCHRMRAASQASRAPAAPG